MVGCIRGGVRLIHLVVYIPTDRLSAFATKLEHVVSVRKCSLYLHVEVFPSHVLGADTGLFD